MQFVTFSKKKWDNFKTKGKKIERERVSKNKKKKKKTCSSKG